VGKLSDFSQIHDPRCSWDNSTTSDGFLKYFLVKKKILCLQCGATMGMRHMIGGGIMHRVGLTRS